MSESDPRAVLEMLASARGDSLAALSAMLGRNAAYLQQYVRRGSPRALAERDRQVLAAYFGVSEDELGGPPPMRRFPIARLAIDVSAGPGAFVEWEISQGVDSIDPALARRLGLKPGQAAIVRVRGTSMEPGLYDGDAIVVDMADREPVARGRIYVVRFGDTVMVKRVASLGRGLRISSDNPDADPLPDAPAVVIGRAVWQMRAPR